MRQQRSFPRSMTTYATIEIDAPHAVVRSIDLRIDFSIDSYMPATREIPSEGGMPYDVNIEVTKVTDIDSSGNESAILMSKSDLKLLAAKIENDHELAIDQAIASRLEDQQDYDDAAYEESYER